MNRASIAAWLVGVAFVLASSGCGLADTRSEAEEEVLQRAEGARKNAVMRLQARDRIESVERKLRSNLKPAKEPTAVCNVEFGKEAMIQSGVVPIACGDYGGYWPFIVKFGFLRCEKDEQVLPLRKVIFSSPQNIEYAVNGDAHQVGYEDLTDILRRNSLGRTIDYANVQRRGVHLCR